MITPIEGLQPISAVKGPNKAELTGAAGSGNTFKEVLGSLVNNVKETEQEKVQAQYLLATGQLDNPASLMIASSKYQVAVDLMVQLRSRALEAYTELTRISL